MKQVIVVRNDLGISTGKLVTQACHAAVLGYRDTEARGDEKKVVVHTDGATLMERRDRAKHNEVPHQLVQDAGKTEVGPGTVTALAVGPAPEDQVDSITGDLPLVNENPNTENERVVVDCGGCGATYDTVEEADNCDCEDLDLDSNGERSEWPDMTRQADEDEQGCEAVEDGEKCGTIADVDLYEYNDNTEDEFWVCRKHFTQHMNNGLGNPVEKYEVQQE